MQRINPQLLESWESAIHPALFATAVGMAGRGRWHPSLQWEQPPSGTGKVGGAFPCPPSSYHQLHPLPSPPLPLPGISQLIPLAASLRHLQGLKTATVPALTPGDPLTSPAPSGCWHCPGAGWAPWPPPCMGVIVPHHPIPGRSWVLSPGHPISSQLGRWGQMWGDPPYPHCLLPACLQGGWGGGG